MQFEISLLLKLKKLIHESLTEIYKHRFEIEYKDDDSPVTKADLVLNNLIIDFLMKSIKDLTILSEELPLEDFKFNQGYTVVIDPIDGTENFKSGLKEWGVAISIWHNQKHAGSLIYLPEMDIHLITGTKVKKIDSRIIGLSSSMSNEFIPIIQKNRENRIMGCAVYNFYNVIRGSYKEFINPKGAYVWDLLAGLQLALENGCEVYVDGKVYDGRFLEPNKKYRVHIKNR